MRIFFILDNKCMHLYMIELVCADVLIELYRPYIERSMKDAMQDCGNNLTLFENVKALIFEEYQRQAVKDFNVGALLNLTIKADDIIECR